MRNGDRGAAELKFTAMEEEPPIDPKLLENPVFKRVLADALAIQDRFAAEPVHAKTGKGFLKSEGVDQPRRLKSIERGGPESEMEPYRPWLESYSWAFVTARNAVLCSAKSALHRPTLVGHEMARVLWEQRHRAPMLLEEAVDLCRATSLYPGCSW